MKKKKQKRKKDTTHTHHTARKPSLVISTNPVEHRSTQWLKGISYVSVWALTNPNPIEFMDVIRSCANGKPLNKVDIEVIITIMESPNFLKPLLDKEQLKIYDKAYERYCAEAVFQMLK